MALTKSDIISRISSEMDLSEKQASETVENILEILKSTLEAGEDVLFSGFGKFCVSEKKERLGRNPATRSTIILPSRRIVVFKCSKKLRNQINEKKSR